MVNATIAMCKLFSHGWIIATFLLSLNCFILMFYKLLMFHLKICLEG